MKSKFLWGDGGGWVRLSTWKAFTAGTITSKQLPKPTATLARFCFWQTTVSCNWRLRFKQLWLDSELKFLTNCVNVKLQLCSYEEGENIGLELLRLCQNKSYPENHLYAHLVFIFRSQQAKNGWPNAVCFISIVRRKLFARSRED